MLLALPDCIISTIATTTTSVAVRDCGFIVVVPARTLMPILRVA
jgi:hypothetical protein